MKDVANFIIASYRVSLREASVYRFDFIIGLFSSIFSTLVSIVVIYAMFSKNAYLKGWDKYSVILLLCIFKIMKSLIATFILPNINNVQIMLRAGTLDQKFIWPVDSQIMMMLQKIDIWALVDLIISLLIISYMQMIGLINISIEGFFLAGIVLTSAIFIYFSIWSMIISYSLTYRDIYNLYSMTNTLIDFGQFPARTYPKEVEIILNIIIPIIVVSTLPTELLLNKSHNYFLILFSVFIAILFLFLSRKVHFKAIERFNGINN